MSIIPTQSELEAEYKLFADSIENFFSRQAQKPASVPGGSGAGLAENPDIYPPADHEGGKSCTPVTMSGDAWEAAAHHVLALRDAKPVNADTWHQIGEFLDAQHLDGLGLRLLPGRSS
jgi:hypothetical protein